ncbi:MAG TPA: CYTH domain-containing protein, partial [Chthoniobacterales bacterium]|jgi:CYTH domain-containing protein
VKNQHFEIERKFLVRQLPRGLKKLRHNKIDQGYLTIGRDRSHVRVRRKGRAYTLTFKRGSAAGREEREIRLTRAQFDVLWPATAGARLTKTRYDVPWKKSIIEIDIYHGSNEGLIVAEVEFPDDASCRKFQPPAWLGPEVTSMGRYSNPRLARD